jgi:2-keto-4-pentenoate hydratase
VADLHPTIAAGLAAQLAARRAALDAGARRVGWKLAYGIAEIEALAGDEPVFGHLTSATLLAPGATYRGASFDRELRVETSSRSRWGKTGRLPASRRARGRRRRAPAGRSRGARRGERPPSRGRVRAHAPRRDGARGRARLLVGGAVREEARVRGDPAAVVAATARLLDGVGERLEPGDRILAGSPCHVPAAAGDAVVAEIGGLGAVAATIAP